MRFDRATRTLCTWMAVLAILMTTFAPVISRALGDGAARTWLEVCSTSKTARAQVDAFDKQQRPVEGGQAHVFEHCPYCALHADVVPVLPKLPRLSTPLSQAQDVPSAFLHAPTTGHVWLNAQPRAPPLSA